ncbi:enoyl-CoA hydratase [Pusillimonas sp. MFBS29]|uniref:oxepin-CoA hydrolase, alternative type n=1 Tax=Pusillimonas sp. MFBS29 TaxID=2886690 RepID=UPI001D12A590|nr:enoyl-CoA hydratase [Pusillimonas sp. MFBS29]MCC2596976.1 enoyl-CoA hydratase [Pusillimonas sp. MFBS29]
MNSQPHPQPLRMYREGAVQVLSIDNPDARNALSPELYLALLDALQNAANDDGIGAIVLTGEGGHFCAGGDLRRLATRHTLTALERRTIIEQLNTVVRALRSCPKPVVAAIEGAVAGAGMSVAFACDVLVGAQDSRYSVAYVKVGLTPDGGITSFLAESLSRPILSELCLTGTPVTGERMYQLGAINHCVEPGKALEHAIQLATKLADGPAKAMACIKQLCTTAKRNTFDEQIQLESQFMIEAQAGSEAREGIASFLEKRKANYRSK